MRLSLKSAIKALGGTETEHLTRALEEYIARNVEDQIVLAHPQYPELSMMIQANCDADSDYYDILANLEYSEVTTIYNLLRRVFENENI